MPRPLNLALVTSNERFGVLQPQETILGILGEYVEPRIKVWSGGLVRLLGDLGFSPAASRIALSRVVARGLLAPSRDGKFVSYTISPRLEAVHREGKQQVFSFPLEPSWEGNWTLVWYSIPEKNRANRSRLVRWLSFRGFKSLQDGTWLAPGDRNADVAPLVAELGLKENVVLLVGTLGEVNDVASFVGRMWKLDELKAQYEYFVATFAKFADPKRIAKLGDTASFVQRTEIIETYRQIITQDPRLPDSALRLQWRRREAIELFQQLQADLFEAADRYFKEHTTRA